MYQTQPLRANRISLNASNTEIILFCPKTKTITKHLYFEISGQKFNILKQAKYLESTRTKILHGTFNLIK